MGGFMTYGRMRNRNGLAWRDHTLLYPAPGAGVDPDRHLIVGDLNRMERDYLDPPPELTRRCAQPDPATECSMVTGIDVETVRAVLDYVFHRTV